MTVMENLQDIFRTLVEDFLEVCDLISVIASLSLLRRHELLGDIRKPMSVPLEFLQPVIKAIFRCHRVSSCQQPNEVPDFLLNPRPMPFN